MSKINGEMKKLLNEADIWVLVSDDRHSFKTIRSSNDFKTRPFEERFRSLTDSATVINDHYFNTHKIFRS